MGHIRIEAATKRFGAVTAVDGVTLDVEDGEFLVLLGPSGCGKSTLLRTIAGLTPLDEGRLELDGRDITHVPPRDRDIAMVFQSYALYPHLTVERNIGFPLRARRQRRDDVRRKVADVATSLELGELLRRRPRELSGGQRQRVALGRALVRDPKIFLMDEPLSNLDAKLRAATRYELVELHRRLGTTFVYVTHDQVEAMTMATRIAILNNGGLEQVGSASAVYDEPASTFVAGFLGSPPMNQLPARLIGVGGELRVVGTGIDTPLGLPDDSEQTEVFLGIRPEHLRRDEHQPALRGTVTLLENLGGEEIAHCLVGETRICVRGPRPLGFTVGEPVGLSPAAGQVHLFHRATGRRLIWQDDTNGVVRRNPLSPENKEQGVPA